MRKYFLLFLSIFWVSICFSQQNWEWVKLITSNTGDVNCEEVTIDEKGNLYVVGNFSGTAIFDSISVSSTGSSDGFIAKLGKNGNFKWIKQLTGQNQEGFTAITYDDGFIYVGGYFSFVGGFDSLSLFSVGGRDIILTKLDTNSQIQWAKTGGAVNNSNPFFQDIINRIELNYQGELVVTGKLNSGIITIDTISTFSLVSGQGFISKFNTSGNILSLFQPPVSPPNYQVGFDSAGNIYAPFSNQFQSSPSVIISSKYTPNFNISKVSIALNNFTPLGAIDVDNIGNQYIAIDLFGTGFSFGPTLFSSGGGSDFILSRFDNQLNLKWARQFGGSGNDKLQKIRIREDGAIISGFFNTSASFDNLVVTSPGQSAFVAKVDTNGSIDWIKADADGVGVLGKSFAVDSSEQVFLVGDFLGQINFDGNVYTGQSFRDGFIAKLGCKPNTPEQVFGDTSVCLDTIIYSVTKNPEISNSWTISGGGILLNSIGDSCRVVWSTPGKHQVEVIASNTCGNSLGKTIEVTVKTIPSKPIISGDSAVCLGTHQFEIINQENALYQWQASGSSLKISLGNNRLFTWSSAQLDTLTAIATNKCGSITSNNFVVTVNSNPISSPTILGNNTVCNGQSIFSINNPATNAQYTWSAPGGQVNNQNDSAIITFNNSGNYSISAFEKNLCGNGPPSTFNVLVNEPPSQPNNLTGDLNPCKGVENYAIIPQAGANYTWSLDSGGAIIPFGNSASVLWNKKGIFKLTIQGNNLCGNGPILEKTITVNDIPDAPASIFGEDSVCIGSQQYFVSLNNSNAIWSLSGGGALNTSGKVSNINWVSPGTFILSAAASNVCGSSNNTNKIIYVDTLSNLLSTIAGPSPSCQDTGSYSVSFQTGSTYNWILDSGGILIDSANTAKIIWQKNGIFNLKVQTNNGCKTNKLIEVIGKPKPLNSIVGDSLVCTGNSAYGFSANSGISYNWLTASGTNVIALGSNAFVNWQNQGLDTLYITGANQCGLDTVYTLPIQVESTPSLSSISGDSLLCKGSIINYQTNFDSLYAYTWQTSGGNIGSSGNIASINWLDSGLFTIQVSASNQCGTSQTLQKQIEVLSKPKSPNLLLGNFSPCIGSETYAVIPNLNQTYQWVLGTGGNIIANNDSALITWNQQGNQNLVIIPQSLCGQGNPTAFTISVNNIPQKPVLLNDSVLCKGLNLFQASSQNSDSLFWNFTGKLNLDTFSTSLNLNFPDTGFSEVKITPKNICGIGDSATFKLQIIDVIAPPNIIGDSISCINQTTFAAPLDTSLSYLWSLSGGGILSAQNNTASVNWLAPGNFNLELRVSNKCGIGPKLSKTIVVSTIPPKPILTQGQPNPCFGNEVYETFTAPNVRYNWIVDSTTFLFDTTSIIGLNITNLNPFSLKTFTQNQCGNSDTLISLIAPINIPNFKPNIFGDSVLCVGNTVTYKTNNGGFAVNWTNTGGGLLNPAGDSCFVTGTQQGSFSIIASSSNKCGIGLSDSIHFQIQDVPQIPSVIQGNLKTCIGIIDSFFTNAPDADSIFWSLNGGGSITGNKTFASATWQNPGTFLLEASPKNFCGIGSSRVAIVEVSELPDAPTVIQGDTFVCKGNQTYIVASNIPANYIWKTNHVFNITPKGNTAKINFDTTGFFNLKILSSNYCGLGDSTHLNIQVLGLPQKPNNIIGKDSLCAGEDLQYLIKNEGETYLWSLTSGGGILVKNDSAKINWTVPGDHQLSVQAQNACGLSNNLIKLIHVDGFASAPAFTVQNRKGCTEDTSIYFGQPGFGQQLNWFVDGGSIISQNNDSVKVLWQETGDKIISAFSENLCGLSAPTSIVIVVNKAPQLNNSLLGEQQVCVNSPQEYIIATTDLTSYNWQFIRAENSAVDNIAFARWAESGLDTISISASNYCGFAGPLNYPIEIIDLPKPAAVDFENGFLIAQSKEATFYQWFYEGTLISAAQDSIFEPSRAGYYQVGIYNICDSLILSEKYLIGFDTENIGLKIYPNPSQNDVTIEIPLNVNWEAFEIRNSLGQIVFETENIGIWKLNFNVELIPAGFYLVRLKSEYGLQTSKFTKTGN